MRRPYNPTGQHRSSREKLQSFGPGGAVLGASLIVIIVIVLITVAVIVPAWNSYTAHHTAEVILTDKERVCEGGDGDCKYLVYTDKTTYQVIDSFVVDNRTITSVDGVVRTMDNRKSSDFVGALQRCHRYSLTYYGWRSGWFSSYENITDAVDLGPAPGCVPEN